MLSKSAILAAMKRGEIKIHPFHENQLGPNGYDLHLGGKMLVMDCEAVRKDGLIELLDVTRDISDFYEEILPRKGYFTLYPNNLYLGVTMEYTQSFGYVPQMEGKSSLGRMGIEGHVCAGLGDDGFCGHWTLEIRVMRPVAIPLGCPIGQLVWHPVVYEGEKPEYGGYRKTGSYNNSSPEPGIPNLWKKPHQFLG